MSGMGLADYRYFIVCSINAANLKADADLER